MSVRDEWKQTELRALMRLLTMKADDGDEDAADRLRAINAEAGFGNIDRCLAIARGREQRKKILRDM